MKMKFKIRAFIEIKAFIEIPVYQFTRLRVLSYDLSNQFSLTTVYENQGEFEPNG